MTKHNYLVRDADDLPRVLAEAFHIARTGRPGPVHVDITKDALQQETTAAHPTDEEVIAGLPGFRPNMDANGRQLKLAAAEIAEAKRPVILAGHGVLHAEAWDDLVAFAEKTQIPVAHTLLGDRRDRRDPSAQLRLHGHARLEARQPGDPVGRPADRDRDALRRPGHRQRPDLRAVRPDRPRRHRPGRDRQERRRRGPDRRRRGARPAGAAADGRGGRPGDAGRLLRAAGRVAARVRGQRRGTARAPGATASCRPTTSSSGSAS